MASRLLDLLEELSNRMSKRELNSLNVTPVKITKKPEKVKFSGDDEIAVTQPLILAEDDAKQISIGENDDNLDVTPLYQEFDGHANVTMSDSRVQEVTKSQITSKNEEIFDELDDVLLFTSLPETIKTNRVTQSYMIQAKIGDTLFVGLSVDILASKNFYDEVTLTIIQGLVHKETLGRKASIMSHYKFRRKLLKSKN